MGVWGEMMNIFFRNFGFDTKMMSDGRVEFRALWWDFVELGKNRDFGGWV